MKNEYCLVILSIQPSTSRDMAILRLMRESKSVPIIALTQKLSVSEKITLFHAGANVCLVSGGGTGRTLHPDNMAAGPASYGFTDTLGRMHSDAQFAGSSSVPAHVEMMGLIGAGNNPMVGMTVSVAVAIEEAAEAGKF